MDPVKDQQPLKTQIGKTNLRTWFILSFLLTNVFSLLKSNHELYVYSWVFSRTSDGFVIRNITGLGPGPESQKSTFDLCELCGSPWNTGIDGKTLDHIDCSNYGHKCLEQTLSSYEFYICPAGPSGCKGQRDFFCSKRACKTIAPWKTYSDKYIYVRRAPNEKKSLIGKFSPIKLSLKRDTYQDLDWKMGKTWGLKIYKNGWDEGILFTLRRFKLPTIPQIPIGPNRILNPPVNWDTLPKPSPDRTVEDHLPEIFKSLYYTYAFFNTTDPDLTKDCWLRLDPRPPYFIGLGITVQLGNDDSGIKNLSVPEIKNNTHFCLWGT
ncbi:MLV-related proviral Env polyprotein-like [Nannospalax galili]|uniref:MLV-related proviral Env polyprotein-like n=1 Tax=Nannospalax galili TaxID=1026970 RepID=UPI00111C8769|nr:MLV-related proviral Env polyprotein-like [Nannospalax galili]